MTDDEKHEFDLLKIANANGKFAIELGHDDREQQEALERLLLRGWARLIDLCPLTAHPGRLFRVFLAEPAALTWLRSRQ